LFTRALIPEFLALGPDAQARQVLHSHAGETRYLDVADPGILDDIDDPDAYHRLLAAG
jgi:CTP:molybdopterin cytidylyltransferase MocA